MRAEELYREKKMQLSEFIIAIKIIQATDDNKTIIKLSKSDGQLTVGIGQFYQKIKQNWQQLTAALLDRLI